MIFVYIISNMSCGNLKLVSFLIFKTVARLTGSQDELDDESVQGKQQQFDNFSMFSSE